MQRQVSYPRAAREVQRAGKQAAPWIERWGRFGHVAHGLVYGLIGVLAMQAALGTGGTTTDKEGALEHVIAAPFGQLLLAFIAIGLVGYATWRFVQAACDTENKGTGAVGVVSRVGYAVSGVVHLALALFAVRLLLGTEAESGGTDQSVHDRTAWLLSQPFGQWLVGIAGLIAIGVGLYQLYQAYTANFREELKTSEMSADERLWAERVGRAGFAARGIVFGTIGSFLIGAAIHAEPGEARGLAGALAELAAEPSGPWLLGAVAIGLVAYGVYSLVEARYGRMMVRR
jgi:hypothetical protein